jgi:hypothetical protein
MATRSAPTRLRSEFRGSPLARALLGALFLALGAACLGALFYISNSRSAAAERAMMSVGLAGSVFASAVAQGLMVVGVWLIWRAARSGSS